MEESSKLQLLLSPWKLFHRAQRHTKKRLTDRFEDSVWFLDFYCSGHDPRYQIFRCHHWYLINECFQISQKKFKKLRFIVDTASYLPLTYLLCSILLVMLLLTQMSCCTIANSYIPRSVLSGRSSGVPFSIIFLLTFLYSLTKIPLGPINGGKIEKNGEVLKFGTVVGDSVPNDILKVPGGG
ncbi:hypothetical protein AVEN_44798-1 [Araneus ventricosus]|uniref:Uncharacterized protein n=1 Tax=Araneus ventricosus TaxID=182803 RepID=A0A4Y2K121_ARAVE|nr:hypothetical protein AVEN_44798-1 [Araneus ventricosus]